MAPGEQDLEVQRCTGCMKMQVDGAGRLNDPDDMDEGPDVTQRALPAGSHLPQLGPLLLGIFISDLDENINYMLVKYTFSKYQLSPTT